MLNLSAREMAQRSLGELGAIQTDVRSVLCGMSLLITQVCYSAWARLIGRGREGRNVQDLTVRT